MDYDLDFIRTFNEEYPFERYIIEEPKSIGYLFDDALLCEVFVPKTEIKPIIGTDGQFTGIFTNVEKDDVYVKIKGPAGEMRMGYFDFSSGIRESIREIFYNDFGQYEWECLFVDHEDKEDLWKKLYRQRDLIEKKYGTPKIKSTPSDELFLKHGIEIV